MSGTFRITCDKGKEPYCFELPCRFGALDGPDKCAELLRMKGWKITQGPDGEIVSAVCPNCLKKEAFEKINQNRGEWNL